MQANERLELISQDEGLRLLALSREKRDRDRLTQTAHAQDLDPPHTKPTA